MLFTKYSLIKAVNRKWYFASFSNQRKVSVISVPVNLGQPLLGPDRTPNALIANGLLDLLSTCKWNVENISMDLAYKLPYPNKIQINAKNHEEVGIVCEILSKQVEKEMIKDNFVLILGGDHCISIGSIPSIIKVKPNTGIIWVDAHADINTPTTSLTGNMHGMPLAFLTGLIDKDLHNMPTIKNWFQSCLSPKDIIYIGLRDVDQCEKHFIKQLGIKYYTVKYF
jgi:arginase